MPILNIDFSDQHNDYFTLTDDAGKAYQWHGRKGATHHPENVLLLIRAREYPDAEIIVEPTVTRKPSDLADWDQWKADNPDVEPVPWKSTHPIPERIIDGKKISTETADAFRDARDLVELKNILSEILFGRD